MKYSLFIYTLFWLCLTINTTLGQIQAISALPTYPIQSILPSKPDSIFIGTDHGLYLYHPISHQLDSFPEIFSNNINALLEYDTTIFVYQFPNSIISFNNPGLKAQLEGKPALITSVTFDRATNRHWIGTHERGLYAISNLPSPYYQHFQLEKLSAPRINAVHIDGQGTLWVGTSRGIYKYQQNTFTLLTKGRGQAFFPEGSIHSIHSRGQSVIFAGMNALWILSESQKWQKIPLPMELAGQRIEQLLVDHRENIWIAGKQLAVYLPSSQSWTQYGQQEGLPSTHILTLSIDQNQRLWIGTAGKGLFCLPIDYAIARHEIFVLDFSASMKKSWKRALFSRFIHLNQQSSSALDQLSLVTFSQKSRTVFLKEDPNQFYDKLSNLQLSNFSGKTKVIKGLKSAYTLAKEHPRRKGRIIFITDGAFNESRKLTRLIKKYSSHTFPLEIFTFGPVGEEPSQRLQELATLGKGKVYHINAEKDLYEKLFSSSRSQ